MRSLVASELRALHKRANKVERRLAVAMLPGKVAEKDPAKRLVRLKIGKTADGRDILGPWSRWQESTAGTSRFHAEPDMGEQMTLFSQSGTVGAASMAMPGTYDKDHEPPSQSSDTAVWECGGGRVELGPDGILLKGRVTITGPEVSHNGHSIGDDHKHKEVFRGVEISGPPV